MLSSAKRQWIGDPEFIRRRQRVDTCQRFPRTGRP
jgi:hypothetical protein